MSRICMVVPAGIIVLFSACCGLTKVVKNEVVYDTTMSNTQLNACLGGEKISALHQPDLPKCSADDPQLPPSAIMERALKFYEVGDYEHAVTLFDSVLGNTAFFEDGCQLQKAHWYRGKALYQAGFYNRAYFEFVLFVRAGSSNQFFCSSVKWMRGLRGKVDPAVLDRCFAAFPDTSVCLEDK